MYHCSSDQTETLFIKSQHLTKNIWSCRMYNKGSS